MIFEDCNEWSVRVVFPKDSICKRDGSKRRYPQNQTFTAVAATLERAAEMVRAKYPEVRFLCIAHVGQRTILTEEPHDVFVDDALAKELPHPDMQKGWPTHGSEKA